VCSGSASHHALIARRRRQPTRSWRRRREALRRAPAITVFACALYL
jgi:hypothetical protein